MLWPVKSALPTFFRTEFCGCALLFLSLVPSPAANFTVSMVGHSFNPHDQTIAIGDTVTWVDVQGGSHDVQSDLGSAVAFRSPPPGTFQTFSFTFNVSGVFPYHCNPHFSLGMRGN